MRRFKTMVAVVASAAAMASPVLAQEIPSETWMGLYLGQAKIGYAQFFIDNETFLGKEGYRLDSTSVTKFLALGVEVQQDLKTTVHLNKNFEPVNQVFRMSSGGHTTTVTAIFRDKEIVAEIESQGTKTTKTIPIPEGSKLVGDSTYIPSAMKMKVGDKLDFRWFNPLTLSLDDLQTEVLRKEKIKLGSATHETYVIKSLTPLGEMTTWQDENGNLLKATALMGITMIREPKEVAQALPADAAAYSPPPDLAVMTAAVTETKIPKPREVRYLRIRLTGFKNKSPVLSDSRQKITLTGEDRSSAEYEIRASDFPVSKAVQLPIKKPGMDKFLAESPYVQPNDSEIVSMAKQIAADEKNSRRVVSRLRAWVNANMQAQGNIGIVRSSVDVLHAKTGVCRDYAVLYTALARAAGIPTKLVAGLVSWNGGFYYHAWAESYVGEWIPVDATLTTDLVDATHIKLVEGDPTAMFDMVKTMGSLKAEIIEFK